MKKVIVGIGEILWDMLPSGKSLGGAPANFAYHAARLGDEGWVVSAVGDDALGKEILDIVASKKLRSLIAVSDRPTGTVQVTLDGKGVPEYKITENVAWDHIPFTTQMKELASKTDAVCFGSLVQRDASKKSVQEFIDAMRPDALKVFDINLRQNYYTREVLEQSLQEADILKINDDEVKIVSDLFHLSGDDIQICRSLIDGYGLDMVVLTKGADGSAVVTADNVYEQKVGKVKVVDTVGAGDAFTAAFVVAILGGKTIPEAQKLASDTASYVCSHKGAMPEY